MPRSSPMESPTTSTRSRSAFTGSLTAGDVRVLPAVPPPTMTRPAGPSRLAGREGSGGPSNEGGGPRAARRARTSWSRLVSVAVAMSEPEIDEGSHALWPQRGDGEQGPAQDGALGHR